MTKFEYRFCPMNNNKIANGRRLSACTCGHSNLVIDHPRFLPNYIYGLLSSNSFPRSTMGIVRKTTTKMAAQMATVCLFVCVDTLTWSFITQFIPYFIYGLLFIKILFISEYGFYQMNDYQACNQRDIPFHCRILCWALCRSRPTVLV